MIPPAIRTFIKGYAMGAANVIPGVSGGTVAFITGIFETLINALKSLDLTAIKFLTKGELARFWKHINGNFLLPLGLGVVISVASLAKLLGYLFDHHPIQIWALFFGLILASIYYVGKTVGRWGAGPLLSLLVGLAIAVGIALIKPAAQNTGLLYLTLCGVVGICSMIIPGLSGSFVLILMGNYRLILDSLSDLVSAATAFDFRAMLEPLKIFAPVMVGVVVGLIAFSHFISWLFQRFRDVAVALLTGFVAGSLMIIWPWKDSVQKFGEDGLPLLSSSGDPIVIGYEWRSPDFTQGGTWMAIGLVAIGVFLVILMENHARKVSSECGV